MTSPNAPRPRQAAWLARPWNDPGGCRQFFAGGCRQFTYGDPGLGAPGVGDWAVTPRIHFGNFPNQTGFVAEMHDPAPRVADAEIQSVEWVGVDPDPNDSDDATNLSSDNPAAMGGGWRIFPGKNAMDAGADDHRDVKVKITVLPAMQDIPVALKLYDPDDPTDADGPIDDDSIPTDLTDNRGSAPDFPATVGTTKIENGFAVASAQLEVSLYPGNNFRVLAAPRAEYLGDIKVIASQINPETQGRLYVDENGDGDFNGEEPPVDEILPRYINGVAAVRSTPLLTVWRRLHVEVDSMGAPPAGT